MTTTDPAIARRNRRSRPPGAFRVLAGLLVGGIVRSLVPAFDHAPTAWGIAGGVILLVLGMAAHSDAWLRETHSRTREGRHARYGAGVGLLAVLLGASAALFLAGSGVAWWLLGGSVATGVLTWLATVGGRIAAEREAEIRRSGRLATGTVTEQGYGAFEEGTRNIHTTVTVSFEDDEGTRRWVARPVLISRDAPIVNGQRVPVHFDPAHPDDESRIVVDF